MGQDIRRFVNLVYLIVFDDVWEILVIEQFLDGLYNLEMCFKIKQVRFINLNDVIQRVVELEVYYRVENCYIDVVWIMSENIEDLFKVLKFDNFIEIVEKNMWLLQCDMRDLK